MPYDNAQNDVSISTYDIVTSIGLAYCRFSITVMRGDLANTVNSGDIQSLRAMKKAVLTINTLCLKVKSRLSLLLAAS